MNYGCCNLINGRYKMKYGRYKMINGKFFGEVFMGNGLIINTLGINF
jgi:hypothetical protein